MKKTLIIIGIIVLGGLIYFAATTEIGVTPPSVSDSPPPAGKAPVISKITEEDLSSPEVGLFVLNIEGENFETDSATNEVIWIHKEKSFKTWGGGWISKDGKNLSVRDIPVFGGDYEIIVRNENGVSNTFTYRWAMETTAEKIDIIPLNAKPGEKVTIKTQLKPIGDNIQIWSFPLDIGKVRITELDPPLTEYRDKIPKGNGFLVDKFHNPGNKPSPDFTAPMNIIDDSSFSFVLPKELKPNTEYILRVDSGVTFPSALLYQTGR